MYPMHITDFVERHNAKFAAEIWGKTVQAVYQAVWSNRAVYFDIVDAHYVITEHKTLAERLVADFQQ